MLITETAVYLLHASPNDDKRRLHDMAEDLALIQVAIKPSCRTGTVSRNQAAKA